MMSMQPLLKDLLEIMKNSEYHLIYGKNNMVMDCVFLKAVMHLIYEEILMEQACTEMLKIFLLM